MSWAVRVERVGCGVKNGGYDVWWRGKVNGMGLRDGAEVVILMSVVGCEGGREIVEAVLDLRPLVVVDDGDEVGASDSEDLISRLAVYVSLPSGQRQLPRRSQDSWAV